MPLDSDQIGFFCGMLEHGACYGYRVSVKRSCQGGSEYAGVTGGCRHLRIRVLPCGALVSYNTALETHCVHGGRQRDGRCIIGGVVVRIKR